MKIYIVKNEQEGAKLGLQILEKAMAEGKIKVLGLATGSSPIAFYDAITSSDLDFSDIVSVNLDEYCGVAGDHEQSYKYFMNHHLFSKKPFKANYIPNGLEEDAQKECAHYDEILAENPIDLQILGIGTNGHIGFNEPGASFDARTSKVSLTPSTIAANARFFAHEDEVPKFAYSMGIKSIREAKKIILFAYGASKKEAIKALVEGPVTEDLPASALQDHPDFTLILDEAAASLIKA